MTTPEMIASIGRALLGRSWQTELAENLSLNRRTMQRWLNGEDKPRPGVWRDLDNLLAERIAELQQVRALLHDHPDARN